MHPFTRDAFRQGDQGFGPHKIVKPLAQLHELRRVEPGPNAASIVQCSLWIIIAEKQRPEPARPSLGSVKPRTTNSSRLRHLTLRQLPLRPGWYGSVRRFETIPSSP
jgi:hypothetical protein